MAEETRERVLAAAGPIFAEKGFQDATIREICQAAGVNLASVNYYFGDKESLYVEAVRRAREMRAAQAALPARDSEAAPEEQLRLFIRGLLTRMLSDAETSWQSQLMLREIVQPSQACCEMVHEHFRPEFEHMQEVFRQLLPAGTSCRRVRQFVFSLVGQCLFYRVAGGVVRILVPEDEYSEAYSIDALTDHIYGMLLAAVGRHPRGMSGPVPSRLASGPVH